MATAFIPSSIETLLGMRASERSGPLALAHSVAKGLPVRSIDRLADAVAPDDGGFKFRLVPKATLERRRKAADNRLTAEESDRLARVAKVFSFTLDVYRNADDARAFLNRPHPMLDMQRPLDLTVASGAGADSVYQLIGRMAYSGGV